MDSTKTGLNLETSKEESDHQGLSRRQLLTVGAGAAGIVAGAGLIRSGGITTANAAGIPAAVRDVAEAPKFLLYMSVKGQKQGQLMGDQGKGHLVTVFGFDFDLVSPRDPASGLSTGRRQYKPITITKTVDAASPQLLQALATNEALTTVDFSFWRVNAKGGSPKQYFTISLENASIAEVHTTIAPSITLNAPAGVLLLEEVSFTFQKITMTDLDGKTSFNDDWENTD